MPKLSENEIAFRRWAIDHKFALLNQEIAQRGEAFSTAHQMFVFLTGAMVLALFTSGSSSLEEMTLMGALIEVFLVVCLLCGFAGGFRAWYQVTKAREWPTLRPETLSWGLPDLGACLDAVDLRVDEAVSKARKLAKEIGEARDRLYDRGWQTLVIAGGIAGKHWMESSMS